MSTNQKDELRDLMKKFLDRSCTEGERTELINQIKLTRAASEMDDLWQEAWRETGDNVKYEGLSWEELLKIDSRKNRPQYRNISYQIIRWSAAAAVVFGVFFMVRWWTQGEDLKIFETGFGENIEFVLDDGTVINLNANSRLTWNPNWEDEGIRKVNLEGEAFFDVSHIDLEANVKSGADDELPAQLPFEVVTSDLTIRVLGTSFNANQRRGKTEVFLEEGAVVLSLNRKDNINKSIPEESSALLEKDNKDVVKPNSKEGTVDVVKMLPGEWVSFSSSQDVLVQKTVDQIEPLTEWKDGTLSYQDVEFRYMLENLEDIYGKLFEVVDPSLLDRRVNVGVPYKDWETVVDMMGWMLDIQISEIDSNQVRIEKRKEN